MFYLHYSDTVLTVLLGWFRGITDRIWSLIESGNGSAGADFLQWFSDNWLRLFIFLTIICSLTDLMVWLIRWKPYYVWFGKRIPEQRKHVSPETKPHKDRAYSARGSDLFTVKEKKTKDDIEWFDDRHRSL